MKYKILALALLSFALPLAALDSFAADSSLEKNFASPPDDARPWVFWFWSDGNITREGITADLEAMRRVGIGGVLIMEVDQGVPKGPVRMMTPEWRAMFTFAAGEAKRLGLKMIMNNDPGWTGSGGPWNTPENSMQKVVWTEQRVSGPRTFDGELRQPQAGANYYRDIAVLAFPTPVLETRAMRDGKPAITTNTAVPQDELALLIDGDKKTDVRIVRPQNRDELPYVQFGFPGAFEACSLEIAASFGKRDSSGRVLCELRMSDDGSAFREVVRMTSNAGAKTFAPVKARFFRVVFSGNDASLDNLRVNEITLSAAFRLDDFAAKSGLGLAASAPESAQTGAGMSVSENRIQDISSGMRDGRLHWRVPEGDWTIVRFGHTSTGKTNYPAPSDARGLEVDKLSAAALDKHFDGFLGKLVADTAAKGLGAETLAGFHVDSWEVGYQNWTGRFRDEFKRLRGYDPVPWLPVFTGRAVGDAALSERFLWDVRKTISDMLNENYAGRMAALARERGRIFSLEGYRNGPFDPLTYTGRADYPVGEFWINPDPDNLHPSVKTMSSAGHIYGKNLIGAEAFTASDLNSKHRVHPYAAKAVGDAAFCAGINHFIVHRYSLQPWTDDRKPGMTMGPWGWEYERTATWWEQGRPWHEYLARCQYMLRQGKFVADICYLQDEEGIKNPPLKKEIMPAPPEGFDYDLCSGEVVLTRMSVKDGRLTLPDGMSYRLLVMPRQRLMTPALLRKIRDLVRDGAVVLGEPPLRAPGLAGYPGSDGEVRALAEEIWGDCDGVKVTGRKFGKGCVFRGVSAGRACELIGMAADFMYQENGYKSGAERPRVRHIHRATAAAEIYFVANLEDAAVDLLAAFRVDGGRPELWRPETGGMEAAPMYEIERGGVRMPLSLGPRESVFVVFRKDKAADDARIVRLAHGKDVLHDLSRGVAAVSGDGDETEKRRSVAGTFTLAAWVKPDAGMDVPGEDIAGTGALNISRNDLLSPAQGQETYGEANASGAGIAVGRNVVCVLEHGAFHMPATLVHRAAITKWTHVAVVFDDGRPSLYLDGKLVRTGQKTAFDVRGTDAAPEKSARVPGDFKGEHSQLLLIGRALGADDIQELMRTTRAGAPGSAKKKTTAQPIVAPPAWGLSENVDIEIDASGNPRALWVKQAGRFETRQAGGRECVFEAGPLPLPLHIAGAWTVRFPQGWGAPPEVELPGLMSWSEHMAPGVKYFSGTATYEKTFRVEKGFAGDGRRFVLDLGDVKNIARVKLNGRDLGILWKPPFRVDATDALREGGNTLEIAVTNTWVNRLIGDEQLPSDREWTRVPRRRGFGLKAYPDWFLRGERSPVGRVTFATWKHYEKDAPLLPSGLIGPVVITPVVRAQLSER